MFNYNGENEENTYSKKNFFQNEIYDYFIGIDDGIILKGNMIGVFSSICLKNMTDLFFELSLKI